MAEKVKDTIQDTVDEVGFLKDAIVTIGATITEALNDKLEEAEGLVERIGKATKRDVNRAFLNLAKGTDKVLANTVAINAGSAKSKNIQKQLQDIEGKKLSLKSLFLQAELAGVELSEQEKEAAEEQLKIQEAILKTQEEQAAKIESKLGLTGKLLEGISKIPVLGGLIDSQKALSKAQKEAAKDSSTASSTMKEGFSAVGKSLKENLTDPVTLTSIGISGIAKSFQQLGELLIALDSTITSVSKNFGTTKEESIRITEELNKSKFIIGDQLITTTALVKTVTDLNNAYGTFAKFSDDTLKTFTELTVKGGLTTEAAVKLKDLSILTNKELSETSKEFAGQVAALNLQNKLSLNEKQILESIKDVSGATVLNLNSSTSAIAEAVFKAKALGLELKDLESISSSLLNFQSSIEDELSAELLTGRQLNLEGARYAALIGNQGMLAEELAKNIGTAEEFTNMTVIAQDALAKSLGMNRNQLADTLIQQERLNKLNAEGNTLQERFNNLRNDGLTVDQIADQLGDEALARQLEGVGVQEKITALTQQFQEALLPVALKILPSIEGFIDKIGTGLRIILPLVLAYKAAMIAAAMASAFTNPLGAVAGFAIAGGILGLVGNAMIGDGIFPADGRAILSPTEGGLIPISNNDDIVVAPRLAQAVAGGGTSQTVENKVDISPSNTNITLSLNGQAIGNANARQDYGVGKSIRALGGNVDYSASV